jgi:hypothetical protein
VCYQREKLSSLSSPIVNGRLEHTWRLITTYLRSKESVKYYKVSDELHTTEGEYAPLRFRNCPVRSNVVRNRYSAYRTTTGFSFSNASIEDRGEKAHMRVEHAPHSLRTIRLGKAPSPRMQHRGIDVRRRGWRDVRGCFGPGPV